MVRKKNQQGIWRWKYTTSHCQWEKIYIEKQIYILEKKKRPTLSYQLKKIKKHTIGWLKVKTIVRVAKLQCKKVLNTK